MKQFLSVADAPSVDEMIEKAIAFKSTFLSKKQEGESKRLGLIFMNPSLRTRVSTQIAAQNLGMEVIILNTGTDGWALEFEDGVVMNGDKVEHIKDAAAVLGKYFDVLAVRTFPSLQNKEEDYSEKVLNAFVKYSGVPVMSMESSTRHPLQSLADVITIYENIKDSTIKPKVVLMWAPHIKPLPQCVANSFAEWMNAWDKCDFIISHPPGYELDKRFSQNAPIIYDQQEALKDADFIYVKNWSSVSDYGRILPVEKNWMLTENHFVNNPDAKIMHCLPVRRNVELSDELLDGSRSLVNEQAANRIWSAQTALSELLKN